MAKPLKFHQTLNQAPRSLKHGTNRRARETSHRHSVDRANHSAGGADQSGANSAWVTWSPGPGAGSWLEPFAEPSPPTIPYAGIRTGELIGHRLWWIIQEAGEDWISSLVHRRPWQVNETIHGDTSKVVGSMFSFGKTIWGGVYCFTAADQLCPEIDAYRRQVEQYSALDSRMIWFGGGWVPYAETGTLVSGTIKMWGDVVEHEHGYRAEFAKLHSIDAMYGPGDIDTLRAKYGVGTLSHPDGAK